MTQADLHARRLRFEADVAYLRPALDDLREQHRKRLRRGADRLRERLTQDEMSWVLGYA